jgi:MFS family permease
VSATAVAMRPASVVRTYLAISGLFTLAASVIWGVNTLFLLDAGLDIFEVFIANAAFTAGMVIFEIPTGVVADTSGRRRSFLLSAVTLLVSTLAYMAIAAVGGGLALFVAASVVLGLGFSFYSGAVEAWLVDALKATGYQGELDRVFARGEMVSGAAMLVGSVAGGLLGNLDLAWPFVVRALLLGGVFLVGLGWMHDVGFTPRTTTLAAMPAEMRQVLRDSVEYGWRSRPVRLLMLVSLFQGGYLMWGFYAWPPYFLELLGRDAVWVSGVVAALVALSTIAGNTLVELFTRVCGKRTTLLLWAAAVMVAAVVGVGLVLAGPGAAAGRHRGRGRRHAGAAGLPAPGGPVLAARHGGVVGVAGGQRRRDRRAARPRLRLAGAVGGGRVRDRRADPAAGAAAAAAAAAPARACRRHRRAQGRQAGAVRRPGAPGGGHRRHHRPPAGAHAVTRPQVD